MTLAGNVSMTQAAIDPQLTAAIAEKVRAAGTSFYSAMRLLQPDRRNAMYAIYAFCREVDDIADDDGISDTARRDGLAGWRVEIDRLYQGNPGHMVARALLPYVAMYQLRREDFLAVIDGMEMDAVAIQAPSLAELDLYCDRVASAVGRLSVRAFGTAQAEADIVAHHLGRALQLTNILRDIDEDAALGRLYLPKEALIEGGITETDIGAILAHPALDRVCRGIAQKTRNYYRRSEALMARCPRRSARSPRMMATVYRGILEKLITRGWHAPRADVRRSKRYVIWAVLRDGIF